MEPNNDSTKGKPSKPNPGSNPYQSPATDSFRPVRDYVEYQEPHRGTLFLLLGISTGGGFFMSLLCCGPLLFVTTALGLGVWIIGRGDIRKMDDGRMDERGRVQTQIGLILCLIFGALSLIVSIAMLVLIALLVVSS